VNDANSPTLGSTPATIENEIASGINASATTRPARTSVRATRGASHAGRDRRAATADDDTQDPICSDTTRPADQGSGDNNQEHPGRREQPPARATVPERRLPYRYARVECDIRPGIGLVSGVSAVGRPGDRWGVPTTWPWPAGVPVQTLGAAS